MNFSLDTCYENIPNSKTREYFKEVMSSYLNGNYRSAIVMLYSTTISDLVYKMMDLKDIYNDKAAINILDKIESKQQSKPTSSEWESILINDVAEHTQLLSPVEKEYIMELKRYRNISAHPVLKNDYELIKPNKEITLGIIKNIFESLLSKDALLSTKAIEIILEDLDKNKNLFSFITYQELLNNHSQLEQLLKNRYFNRMNDTLILKSFSNFWKFVFFLKEDKHDNNRTINFKTLDIIYSNNESLILDYIKNNSDRFSKIDDDLIEYLFIFLCLHPKVYFNLSESIQVILQEYANNPYSHPYSYILVSHFLETDFDQYLDKLKEKHWLSRDTIPAKALYIYATNNGYKNDILNVFIKIFKNSSSFMEAYDAYDSLIEPFFDEMEKNHIKDVVAAITSNNQIYNAINIRKRDIIIDNYCKKFLGENFSIAEEIDKTLSEDK